MEKVEQHLLHKRRCHSLDRSEIGLNQTSCRGKWEFTELVVGAVLLIVPALTVKINQMTWSFVSANKRYDHFRI